MSGKANEEIPAFPFVVVDVETGGLREHTDALLEIGAVDLRGGEWRLFSCDVRAFEGSALEARALEVNGIDPVAARSEERTSEAAALAKFASWLGNAPVVMAGMNPHFDLRFLAAACDRTGVQLPFVHRVCDLHTLAWWSYSRSGLDPKPRGLSADFISEVLDMNPEERPHRAVHGAAWAARCFMRLDTIATEGGIA